MKRLFVDDERDFPEGWDIARSFEDAMILLSLIDYDEISLDHDIASWDTDGTELTGYTILCYLERQVLEYGNKIPFIYIHTANPAVRCKMQRVADALNKVNYDKSKE